MTLTKGLVSDNSAVNAGDSLANPGGGIINIAGATLNITDSTISGNFTLSNVIIAAADAATTTTIQESGAFTNALRGDLVINHTRSEAISYVIEVT